MLEHGIDDGQELAHAVHARDLLGFTCRTQAAIEATNDGIKSRGDNRPHR